MYSKRKICQDVRVTDTREYHSPLREQQAKRTRIQILDALVDLVSEQGAADLSIRDLAIRSGVSQRTVYRHFPDRQALLDGLVDHVGELADWSDLDGLDDGATGLASAVRDVWESFDAFERQTRVLVLLNKDPDRLAHSTIARGASINRAIANGYPHLNFEEAKGVAGIIRLLASSHSWLRFRDEYEMTSAEGSRYVSWALDLVMRELDRGEPIPQSTD